MCGTTAAPPPSSPPVPARENLLLPSTSLNMQLFSLLSPFASPLLQTKWADLGPAGPAGARLLGEEMQLRLTERGADPVPPCRCSPRAERAALPPRHALASREKKKQQTKTCAGRVQFVAVQMGVQVQPYTCYRYGPYTCLHPVAEPPPVRVRLRLAMRIEEGARRGAQGAAEPWAAGMGGGGGCWRASRTGQGPETTGSSRAFFPSTPPSPQPSPLAITASP